MAPHPGSTEFTLETEDGFRISGVSEPSTDSKAVVVFCHGITADRHESDGFFDFLSNNVRTAGFDVVRFDYRGHGASSGSSLDFTLTGQRLDLKAVLDWVKETDEAQPKLPVCLVAASFGCSSAVWASARGGISRLVLINPVVDYRLTFVKPSTEWTKAISRTRAESSSLPPGASAQIPQKDFFLSELLWREMTTDATPATLRTLSCPTLAFHGRRDRKVPVEPLIDLANSSPTTLELVLFPSEDHGLRGVRTNVAQTLTRFLAET